MVLVTGDRYLDSLVKFVENNVESLIEGTLILKLNPIGLHYVHSRLESLSELESLLSGAPVDYLRAYVSDLGDHRALERLRRILRLLTSLKVVSVLPPPARDPTPLSLLPFGRLKVLELRGCDLSTSAARGLLELRHTLEKLICHNSTDALKHVFASRIADINNSPHWNRLSFISCARNGLVLMDESLQLLPAVETLDLSRNKFAKVDNLRKCTKLKHLDLGFNHLRNVVSFSGVSSHIVKLVLRNNALTSLRGIENLKSLQGLDISYNIISNFLEMEILAGLSSLQRLWLEGNPLCYSRWYRAQVFSFFPSPEKMELDEKKICTSELWQRQIIIASRQKRPASFGFYSPARVGAKIEGSINTKRKKLSRVASIETEEQNTSICSDIESASVDIDNQSKEENALSDEEAEIVELMNRIENMKKERSDVWLQEFKDWVNDSSDNFVGVSRGKETVSSNHRDDEVKTQNRDNQLGETSKYLSDSMLASGDDSSTNILESDNSFAEMFHYPNQIGEASSRFSRNNTGESIQISRSRHQDIFSPINNEVLHPTTMFPQSESYSTQRGLKMSAKINIPPLTDADNILDSRSSLASTGSPPHYKEDILHRRQNLEEELLQLSAESFSAASSDSDTSCSDDDCPELTSMPLVDQFLIDNVSERSVDSYSPLHLSMDVCHEKLYPIKLNCRFPARLGTDCAVVREPGTSSQQGHISTDRQDVESVQVVKQDADWLEKKKRRRKPARRIISLCEENEKADDETAEPKKLDLDINGFQDGGVGPLCASERASSQSAMRISLDSCGRQTHAERSRLLQGAEKLIKNYFNKKAADSGIDESCQRYILCNCLLEKDSQFSESEVAVTLSSEHKLHVLLLENSCVGSGSSLKLAGCHGFEQMREVFVGLGLQIVSRVCFGRDTTYLFVTRNIDVSRELLSILGFIDSHVVENDCSLRSLENVQADLFERHVCGGLKMSILQYSMVMFWCNNWREGSWLRRSLFVLGRHLILCTEDVTLLGSLSESVSCSSYFSLDSCCSIVSVSEVVIDTKDCYCVTLTLEGVMSKFPLTLKEGKIVEDTKLVKRKPVSGPQKWKLKWFSEESLFQFVSLLKALHGEATTNSLLVYRHQSK
ncbi:uncharacterized protein LOC132043961 isoform X3 [Lycium ferocissimum]|uniref:uncharacterized protein LOC132043961 isoform X3 n=1 Tax=Lycium ferocissimum TaxID=112874 RepID=UPI002814F638|nr:uncharacterized protein LOC132043961 isoform X3 [Lycium ferocissimum]